MPTSLEFFRANKARMLQRPGRVATDDWQDYLWDKPDMVRNPLIVLGMGAHTLTHDNEVVPGFHIVDVLGYFIAVSLGESGSAVVSAKERAKRLAPARKRQR